jgi:hypothetical protein
LKTTICSVLLALWCISHCVFGQTIIEGKVTDAETGDPIPFASVYFQGTTIGVPTDFDGFYRIKGEAKSDTLVVSYIGYETKTKAYQKGVTQTINFQLNPEATALSDFVVTAGKVENPAFDILRQVMDHKPMNDKRRLAAYEFDSYNKIEIDVDNISDKLRQKKFMRKIAAVLDSIEVIAGEDGKPILPLFISESLSRYYYRSDPRLSKEEVLKTKITGVGIEDGSLISQVIGSSFQQYNFYQNRMNIVEKEFASPIADGWRILYDYVLEDSVTIGGDFCYLLDFKPKNDQELAFVGKMWITKRDFAIKQIDATVQRTANLNFIEKIKIQQELDRVENGAWLPVKTRVLVDVAEITNKSAGFLAKFYTSNQNLRVTEPRDTRFFERAIELSEQSREYDESFWEQNRHDKLTPTEINVISMIDTLKNIPIVKTWTTLAKTFARGYVEVGAFDLGPWPFLLGNNNIEGWRVRVGGRTNEHFSRRWQFNGYMAYGFDDEKYKYGLGATWIADRNNWTTFNVNYRKDIDQFGIQPDALTDIDGGTAFLALTQLGNLVRPFRYESYQLGAFRQFSRAFSAGILLTNKSFQPEFDFRYRTNLEKPDSPLGTDFSTSEVTLRLKYARDESFIINDNSRISLGTLRWPMFMASVTRGFKGVAGGDFDYTRINFGVQQRLKLGFWGVSNYQINAGHTFEDLPYTLLNAHIGNEQIVYTTIAFNTMQFYEFVSQSYASLRYQHQFGGFILNRVPLVRKLKWRLVGTGNILFGGVSQSTLDVQALTDENGNSLPQFDVLENGRPFAEVGVGVENIFKFFRVDYIRRLTYLENPGVEKSAIKFSFNLSL